MTDVSIRDLRNKGGEIVDRAAAGEPIRITRDGKPVAELTPVRQRLTTAQIVERWKNLPPVDAEAFRRDVDACIDQSL
jgi:prevent-host-death family protein